MKINNVQYLPKKKIGGAIALLVMSMCGQAKEIEEIVVTSSKRGAENLQDIPASVQAFGGEQLMREGLFSLDAMVTKVPGLNLESFGPGDSEYIIRGVNASGESTVGVYYDESVITGRFEQDGGGKNADIRMYDIERLEVLKGPQGTLYGANSMSGTVKIITNKPNLEEIGGSIGTSFSNTKESDDLSYDVHGVLNLPLIENRLGARLVAWQSYDAGWVDNAVFNLDDQNDNDVTGARLHVLYHPTDNVSALLTYTHQERESDGNSRVTPDGRLGAGDVSQGLPPARGGDFISTEHSRTPWDEELDLVSLTVEMELSSGVVTGTVSHYDRDIFYSQDSTPINLGALNGFFQGLLGFPTTPASVVKDPQNRKLTSGELRFASKFDGPVNFVAGVFAQKEESEFNLGVINVDANGHPLDPKFVPAAPLPMPNSVFGRFLDGERKKSALFTEVTWDINDVLSLTGGVRLFKFDIEESQGNTGPAPLAGSNALSLDSDEDNTTYKLNLAYRPNEDTTLYGSVSTGFRPGGTNVGAGVAAITGATDIPESFDSDELTNYELGAKFSLLDGALKIDTALYMIDWEDIQVESQTNGFIFLDNAGAATILGAELIGSAWLTDNLNVTFGVSYTDTEFDEDQPFLDPLLSFTASKGDEIPKTPEFTLNLGATYNWELGNGMSVAFGGDLFYRGSSYTDFSPVDATGGQVSNPNYHKIPSYTRLNLNATLNADAWSVTVFADNVFDKYIVVDAISALPQDPLSYITGRPRTVGARLTYNF